MSSATPVYELYRRTSIGTALTEALDQLISDSQLEPQLARRLLSHFDRVMMDELRDTVRARLHLKGHLKTYRCCDDVWRFVVTDIVFKMDDGDIVNADKIKIVACSSKKPQE